MHSIEVVGLYRLRSDQTRHSTSR